MGVLFGAPGYENLALEGFNRLMLNLSSSVCSPSCVHPRELVVDRVQCISYFFIFRILNIFIQGTNSISILFYNLALLKLKNLINYLQMN